MEPSNEHLLKNQYSVRDYLNFFVNMWTRSLAAYLIDVEMDTNLKATDPEFKVSWQFSEMEQPSFISVRDRLEYRKQSVANARKQITTAEALLALKDDELAARYSPEALTPDPEAFKSEQKVDTIYEALKDFDNVKAGAKFTIDGWTPEQIQQRISDGEIKVFDPAASQEESKPEDKVSEGEAQQQAEAVEEGTQTDEK